MPIFYVPYWSPIAESPLQSIAPTPNPIPPMLGSPSPLRRAASCAFFGIFIFPLAALAAPTANDDSFSVAEDNPLVVSNAPLIDANFDGGSGGVGGPVAFNGN